MSKFMMRITRVMIMMFSYVCATLPVTPDSTMIITWAPDTEFNLKNYRIYYGAMSKSSEPNPGVLYHFAITAYDNRGNGNPEVNVVKQAGDEMPLAIISVEPVTPILLKIVFNRAVDRKSAEQISHYKIVPPVAIEKASLQANATTVFLFTKPHQVNTTYRLTVTNLQDKASPPNTISSQEYTLNPDPGVSNIVLTEHSTVANYSIKTNHLILKNLMIPIAPSYTEGLMWINGIHRTRSSEEISHIHFDMDQEITLFVGKGSEMPQIPDWLNKWAYLNLFIVDSENNHFNLYYNRLSPDRIILSGNYREPHNKTYLVINESPIPMVDTDYLTASLSPQIYKLPEPFRLLKATRLRYKLETSAPVTVKIYDSSGNLVKTQLDGISKPAGDYVDIFWDGTNEFGDYITDGVYLCRVTADGRTNVVKIIILPES